MAILPPWKRIRNEPRCTSTSNFTGLCGSRQPKTDRSVSEPVSDAVRQSLAEDAEDLAAFEERAHEPSLLFEDVLKDLKKRGRI